MTDFITKLGKGIRAVASMVGGTLSQIQKSISHRSSSKGVLEDTSEDDFQDDVDTSFLEKAPTNKRMSKSAGSRADSRSKTEDDVPSHHPQAKPQEATPPKKEEIEPETKADSFVEHLLSDDQDVYEDATNNAMEQDVSDSYYYSYMEKRYINKIMKNPKDVASYKRLGELYLEMKNYADAYESFTFVLKLKPEDTQAQRRLRELKKRGLSDSV